MYAGEQTITKLYIYKKKYKYLLFIACFKYVHSLLVDRFLLMLDHLVPNHRCILQMPTFIIHVADPEGLEGNVLFFAAFVMQSNAC